ncbi:hypothetical protein ACLBKS_02195 [Hylemonella sp. W303a]|uniref:hypothetical protein n=1 Tax=Hylemonella sp. W303a TaxID=3389873 RepID=UPI00396B259A
MSTLSEQRAAILAAMEAVPGIGQVHSRERYSTDENLLRQFYMYSPPTGSATDAMTDPHVRGWWLRRSGTQEWQANTARTVNLTTWQIQGFLALDDAASSELILDDLIERLRSAMRTDLTFGGIFSPGPVVVTGEEDNRNTGVQVIENSPKLFAGVLCHSTQLQLTTWSHL